MYSKVDLGSPLLNISPNCSTMSILTRLILLKTIFSWNQIVLMAKCLLLGIYCGGRVSASIKAPSLCSWMDIFISTHSLVNQQERNQINNGKFLTSMSQCNDLCFHCWKCCLGLQFWWPQDQTVGKINDKTSAALDAGGMTQIIVSIHSSNISIKITIYLPLSWGAEIRPWSQLALRYQPILSSANSWAHFGQNMHLRQQRPHRKCHVFCVQSDTRASQQLYYSWSLLMQVHLCILHKRFCFCRRKLARSCTNA